MSDIDQGQVDSVIAEAHLPRLVMSVVHLTGDTSAAGRVSQNWPFPIVDCWYATREARAEDLVLRGQENATTHRVATA